MVISVISMAEATGQTVAIAEAVQGYRRSHRSTKTIRGDAIISLLGACLGIIADYYQRRKYRRGSRTGVRSRYVRGIAA